MSTTADYPLTLIVNETGGLTLVDRRQNVEWKSEFTGWVELSDQYQQEVLALPEPTRHQTGPGEMHLSFEGLQGKYIHDPDFRMTVKIAHQQHGIDLEIMRLETAYRLHSVEYPAHLLNVLSGTANGAIYVPHLQGIMIPARYDVGFMRSGQNVWRTIADVERKWTFESGNLNMPWFGASVGDSSIFVHVRSSVDCRLHIIGNTVIDPTGKVTSNRHADVKDGIRLSSLTPVWLASKGQFAYPRKLTLMPVENGYQGMAAQYKRIAQKSGRYVTLAAKIKQNPEHAKLIGAPDIKIYCYTNRKDTPELRAWSEPVLNGYSKVNTTFEQVIEIIDDLKAMDIQNCLILLAGWNRMGYDREHVDVWPPAAAAGGAEGLQRACRAALDAGYIFALHDNYDDFYPDAPSYHEDYILKDANGTLHQGGVWDGGLCYIMCPAEREAFLNRNMQEITAHIPLNGYYFDVITNTSHYECYDENHPITRVQDLNYRRTLLKNIRERGLLVGGERGTDWAIPDVAFCEGLSGGGAGYHQGISYRTGINVPLFYLVYRECVVGYWQHGTPFGREDHANHVLLDLLYAQPSSWSIEYEQWDDLKLLVQPCYDLLGKLHKRTAHRPMTSHQFLSDDYAVQTTMFGDDIHVWVNFGFTSFSLETYKIPPKGFIVQLPDTKPIIGAVARTIELLTPDTDLV